MNLKRRQKLLWLTFLLAGVGIAVGLTLYALKQNINLFYTPSQVQRGEVPQQRYFRIGGLVKADSLQRSKNDLQVNFVVTDKAQDVRVTYRGILPDLFREGQGVVAQGKLNKQGVFVADQVLAKHDEKYMPPEAAYAIKQAQVMK